MNFIQLTYFIPTFVYWKKNYHIWNDLGLMKNQFLDEKNRIHRGIESLNSDLNFNFNVEYRFQIKYQISRNENWEINVGGKWYWDYLFNLIFHSNRNWETLDPQRVSSCLPMMIAFYQVTVSFSFNKYRKWWRWFLKIEITIDNHLSVMVKNMQVLISFLIYLFGFEREKIEKNGKLETHEYFFH